MYFITTYKKTMLKNITRKLILNDLVLLFFSFKYCSDTTITFFYKQFYLNKTFIFKNSIFFTRFNNY